MLSKTPTTTQAMAQTDIKDIVTAARGTTLNANFIQTESCGLNFCAGRGCAGALSGKDMVIVG